MRPAPGKDVMGINHWLVMLVFCLFKAEGRTCLRCCNQFFSACGHSLVVTRPVCKVPWSLSW